MILYSLVLPIFALVAVYLPSSFQWMVWIFLLLQIVQRLLLLSIQIVLVLVICLNIEISVKLVRNQTNKKYFENLFHYRIINTFECSLKHSSLLYLSLSLSLSLSLLFCLDEHSLFLQAQVLGYNFFVVVYVLYLQSKYYLQFTILGYITPIRTGGLS